MAYRTSSYGGFGGGGFGGFSLTPWVKRLLIANTAVFLVAFIAARLGFGPWITDHLALEPRETLFEPWTILTYAFLHLGIGHVFFNMLSLFFFGPMLEERWGSRAFIRFYLVAAAGSALFAALEALFIPDVVVLGASGAIYGLMMAFAMAWPTMPIHVWGIFPIQARWLVAIMAVVSLLLVGGGGVSHLAHLGGFATAFLYLKSPWAPSAWGELPPSRRKPGKAKEKERGRSGLSLGWLRKQPPPPAAPTPQKPAGATNRARDEQQLLDDVDRILEKISARGLNSLTDEERKRLDEVSRRYRSN
ncbi:MAG TPA: rhomboid family intramembrane serine protease [Longimicrobiaceae bacterium]|jgi:membrane associated rhomboid family serine protease